MIFINIYSNSKGSVTPCSFKLSIISLLLQGRSSGQRITPLEELRDWCNDILTEIKYLGGF